jgi:hypothetical protein
LVMLLFPENPRNSTLFLSPQPKPNIGPWQLVLVKSLGCSLFFVIFTSLILNQLFYFVTARLLSTLQLILSFTRRLSILISTVTLFVIKSSKVYFEPCTLLLNIKLLTFLLRLLAEFRLNTYFPR